jgi:hypothetical protein
MADGDNDCDRNFLGKTFAHPVVILVKTGAAPTAAIAPTEN